MQTQILFGDLLNYVCSATGEEQAALELVYHKYKDSKVKILLTVRYTDNNTYVSADTKFQTIIQELRATISGRLIALSKSEKILSSSVSYFGYYYEDVLTARVKQNELSNFDALVQQMSLCDEATVSFQFIPTQLFGEEYYALSSLSGELATTMQGIFVGNQMIREVGTETSRKAYSYYSERVSHSMFTGSTIVKANQEDTDALVSAINRCIGNSVDYPVPFYISAYKGILLVAVYVDGVCTDNNI